MFNIRRIRTTFTLFNYIIDIGLSSLHKWTHFKIHRNEYSRHLVWGRLSIHIINWTIECHALCGECGSASLKGIGWDDEYLTKCESCQTVEGSVDYVNYVDAENAECV
jgi:hypothetical protein